MIRAAIAQDAQAICDLWNEIIETTTHTFTSTPKTPKDVAALLGDPKRCILVAYEDVQFAGFALFGPFRDGPGYGQTAEHTIYLHRQAQGRGIGAALLRALEGEAGARGVHVLVAALNADNAAGRAFHTAMGFAQVGNMPQVGRKGGQWQDLILMQKIIGSGADISQRHG